MENGMPYCLYRMKEEERNKFDIRTVDGVTTIHLKKKSLIIKFIFITIEFKLDWIIGIWCKYERHKS